MPKFTDFSQFSKQFPNSDSIVQHIARVRFGEKVPCPECRSRAHLFLCLKRRRLRCSQCNFEIGVLTQTLFDHSKIPLQTWFYLMLITGNTSNVLPVSFVARHMGLSRMAAFAMVSRIRLHLQARLNGRILGGGGQILQVDETWIRQIKNPASRRGYGAIVFGIYSDSGVITKVVPSRSSNVLMQEVLASTHPDSIFVTDQLRSYNFLGRLGLRHVRLNHSIGEWKNRDGFSSVGIESYWGSLKSFLRSVNAAPSVDYFGGYLAEHAFRFNCRQAGLCPFQQMISHFPSVDKRNLPKALIFGKNRDNLA